MINYNEALKTILASFKVLEADAKASFNCMGQVLAEDEYSELNLPLADCAAIDGYAVRSSDILRATKNIPVSLFIIETVRAGSLTMNPVAPGTAIRLQTGSVLPEGADCVVRIEDTDEPENKVVQDASHRAVVNIYISLNSGRNVRRTGTYISKGALILSRGTLIGPNQISVLISLGKTTVKVVRKPVVSIISTGDELISPGHLLSPEKSYNCNTASVSAMVDHYGGIPEVLGVARDYDTSILAKIRRGLEADAVITSGGLSRGDYGLVLQVMARIGEVKFSRIKMWPGTSFAFGIINKLPRIKPVPIFALSGPPAGCIINFETLVRPAILKMRGYTSIDNSMIEAIVEDASEEKHPVDFVKWTILRKEKGEYRVRLNNPETEGTLYPIAKANSLTIVPAGNKVRKGDKLKVHPLGWCQEFKPKL